MHSAAQDTGHKQAKNPAIWRFLIELSSPKDKYSIIKNPETLSFRVFSGKLNKYSF